MTITTGLKYIWGKKFMLIALLLLVILLPGAVERPLQIQNTAVITALGIETGAPQISVSCEILVPDPGKRTPKYESVTASGDDITNILNSVGKGRGQYISLAHCSAVVFSGKPDTAILKKLLKYAGLRTNTAVISNGSPAYLDSEKIERVLKYNAENNIKKTTIDDILRNT